MPLIFCSGCGIGKQVLRKLADALEGMTALRSLNLSCSCFFFFFPLILFAIKGNNHVRRSSWDDDSWDVDVFIKLLQGKPLLNELSLSSLIIYLVFGCNELILQVVDYLVISFQIHFVLWHL